MRSRQWGVTATIWGATDDNGWEVLTMGTAPPSLISLSLSCLTDVTRLCKRARPVEHACIIIKHHAHMGQAHRPVFRCQPAFLAVSFSAQRFLTCPCSRFPYWRKPHFCYFSIFSDWKQGRCGQGPISFCWGVLHLFAHIGMMISFQLAMARINYNLRALVPQRNGLVTVHVLNCI